MVLDFISVAALSGFSLCPDLQILGEVYTCGLETLFVDMHLSHLEDSLRFTQFHQSLLITYYGHCAVSERRSCSRRVCIQDLFVSYSFVSFFLNFFIVGQ